MQMTEMQGLTFLKGGGEMGELIRTKDWSNTSLGTPDTWPQSLRTVVSILLNSQFPMFIWWGEELTTIYNDAYRSVAGEKHPTALGKPGPEVWAEIWDVIGPLAANVMQEGVSNWAEDQVLYMNRKGFREETYFTFSYSPVLDESGKVGGVFCACTETTEKVLAARKIKESEQNLLNTILQAPVAMCILRGPSYIVEIANEHMFNIWGRPASQMLQKPIFDGLPEAKEQGLEELLQQVIKTGERVSAYERPVLLPRDGHLETTYINFVYEPFRQSGGSITGIICVAVDMTQQVLARKRIEESEQELQVRVKERTAELQKQNNLVDNILSNSSNGISVTEMVRNEQGRVIDARTILANEAAVKFTGLSRELYLTKTAVELDPDIISSPYGQTCLKTLETGEPSLIQYFLEYTGRWLELTISKMDDDHLIHIFTDITPMKEAQLQQEKLVDELKRSNANLEDFAYAASHDMKEPIRKIHFFSDRLKQELKDQLSENQMLLFGRMEHAALRMRTLIDDLLTYSHVSRGLPDVEEVDLNQKVQNVLEDLEVEIQEKDAMIKVDGLPVIRGHRRQIQQVFQNLIGNSLKYAKPGIPPVIEISAEKIQGKSAGKQVPVEDSQREFYLLEIKDNGVGFDQVDAERIFNMFTRLHGNAEYRGTGVGLSIVKKVMSNHKGFVWAESTLGKGTTFKLLFPVE